jgi:hypothetical protein
MISIHSNNIRWEDEKSELIIDFNEMSNKQLWEVLHMIAKLLEKRDS